LRMTITGYGDFIQGYETLSEHDENR